jgi:hypothetical protein
MKTGRHVGPREQNYKLKKGEFGSCEILQMIGSESARELPPKKSSSNHQTPDTMKFFAEEDTDVFAQDASVGICVSQDSLRLKGSPRPD